MVYHDLSDFDSTETKKNQIAPAADRFLAVVFDVVIFSPIFSFILAPVFRHVELMSFLSPRSIEHLVLISVAVLFGAVMAILFQTLCLLFWGATPGKYFLKLRVISVSSKPQRLIFSQVFLRSALWVGEFFLFALPWLEVLSESQRRPLHDRAAGTMVITLKQQGDQGPHLLETQFIRQVLVGSSMLFLTWGIFTLGHFYQQAVRGDFKKAELEADEYLCRSVSQYVDPQDHRIDKAVALYLAKEISESCLLSEADFVLWAPSEVDKSWAYLAKAIARKNDRKQFEAYLQKSCDQDEAGVACALSEFEANPESKAIPVGSTTALVLQAIRDFASGNYKIAEKEFISLSSLRGFETFTQQGLVKSLWAQNKIERSKGAYLSMVHQMERSSRMGLTAWICHEELDRTCSSQPIEACEELKKDLPGDKTQAQDSYTALAIIREQECHRTENLDLIQDQKNYQLSDLKNEQRKDFRAFIKAISRDSVLTTEQRQAVFKDIGFRKEQVKPHFLRVMAIQNWIQQENETQLVTVVKYLKDEKIHDLNWIKIYQKTLSRLLQLKSTEQVKEIASLPSKEMIEIFQIEKDQIQAQNLTKELRAPASTKTQTTPEIPQ